MKSTSIEATGVPMEGSPGRGDSDRGREWLTQAIQAHDDARRHFQAELSTRVRKAIDHFNNKHASDSKFVAQSYPAQRSRTFRPNTRKLVNKALALGANAFFATSDVVQVEASNKGDKKQGEAAKFRKAVLNPRLANTIPWFLLIGGMIVDAEVTGVAVTRTRWRKQYQSYVTIEKGQLIDQEDVTADSAWVELVPIEDFMLHPQCDWTDPVGSSPYIIHRGWRTVDDHMQAIQRRQKDEAAAAERGEEFIYGIPYRNLSRDEIERYALIGDAGDDSSGERAKRNPGRTDQAQGTVTQPKFGSIRIWHCIFKVDGVDWYFETLNRSVLLSDPVPLSIVQYGYPKRTYHMGSVFLAPGAVYPEGPAGIAAGLQAEINENTNQRIDNIRQQTNVRNLVRRGSSIDLNALMRSVPGGIILTGDPNTDVKPMPQREFGPAVYNEGDRLSVEMDDVTGNFGGASVQTNRALNQTVGGMDLLGENANVMSEFKLRCLSETVIEPTLRTVDDLTSRFETDDEVIEIALADAMVDLDPEQKAEIEKQFPQPPPAEPPAEGQQAAPPPEDPYVEQREQATKSAMKAKALRMFRSAVKISVSVGFGNTSPQKRLERLSMALQAVQAFAPQLMQMADLAEICKEIMGAAGYDMGSKFFPALRGSEDPRIAMLLEQVAMLTQQLEAQAAKEQVKIQVAQIQAQTQVQVAQIRAAGPQQIAQIQMQLKGAEFQHRQRMDEIDAQLRMATSDIERQRLYLEREALSNSILTWTREFELKVGAMQQQRLVQEQQALATSLSKPGSGEVSDPFPEGNAQQMGGNDRAGVLARGNFGAIPGVAEPGPGR